jgi:hypothetical protein
MAFSILDHIEKLETSDHLGKYICPACGGNDLSINTNNGAYNCFNDDSAKHRAEIRNILAPLDRWERPLREPQSYTFPYKNRQGETTINVHRDDASGKKTIKQGYPSVPQGTHQRKAYIDEIRSTILPYRFDEALTASQVTGLPIFIVEGELTCDRLWEIGIPSVTFLGGSGQYRANGDYSLLFRGKKIVLCPDRDEPGIALMREVASDNPGAQWLYADPGNFEWDSLPQNGGYDLADWLDDGADQELILSSIVSKDRHEGKDGLPSYEEIIGTFERMVGLFDNDARVAFEASKWLEAHGVKMAQANIDKMIDEARSRLFGKEEIETIDVLQLIDDDSVREWLIAGIVPLGSVTLLAAQGGTGKAGPLWSKVLTPTGWRLMGDIQVGDAVIAGDGSATKVTGVFPQGKKPIFKVQMSDGSTTHCCNEHLWLTKTQKERDGSRDWNVRSLSEIRQTLHLHKNHGRKDRNHSIPMVGPVQFEEQKLPIHPYLLGVILGDGSITKSGFSLTISDDEITDSVLALLPPGHGLTTNAIKPRCTEYTVTCGTGPGNLRDILRELNLFGCRSWEKFVPEKYIYSSVEQRLALLHGLMDTDGTTGGTCTTFDSSSEALRDAVVAIVQSLGGKAVSSERQPWFSYKGEKKQGRISYRAFISMPPGFKSFKIASKASKEIERTKYVPARFFDSIEYVGDHEAQCIMVDHPSHTYVTDDFIVTHNTSLVYNWALGVATGSSWSGRRCLPGKCLLISADEPLSDTKEKLSIIGYQEANIQPGMISFWETWRFAHMQQLERFIKKHRPVFVVIDSLTACFAGMNVDLIKSNAGDSLYALRDMANVYKCSIVILHHLNRQGGLRDSSSFVDNVSEVVKLYRQEGNFDQNQFVLEWVKSRSGLAGKHVLKRNAVNYGWDYAGPLGNSIAELDRVANYVNMRPHERFSKQQVSLGAGMNENVTTGKLLEMARRQGLITSSFIVGPHDERTRMYHSWDYQGPDLNFGSPNEEQNIVPDKEELPIIPPVSIVPNENLPEKEDQEDWF